jgi:hypothetical protein
MSSRSSGIIVLLILVAKNKFSKLNRRQKMLICTRYLSGPAGTPARFISAGMKKPTSAFLLAADADPIPSFHDPASNHNVRG